MLGNPDTVVSNVKMVVADLRANLVPSKNRRWVEKKANRGDCDAAIVMESLEEEEKVRMMRPVDTSDMARVHYLCREQLERF